MGRLGENDEHELSAQRPTEHHDVRRHEQFNLCQPGALPDVISAIQLLLLDVGYAHHAGQRLIQSCGAVDDAELSGWVWAGDSRLQQYAAIDEHRQSTGEHDVHVLADAEQRADCVIIGRTDRRERELHLRFAEPPDCGGNDRDGGRPVG